MSAHVAPSRSTRLRCSALVSTSTVTPGLNRTASATAADGRSVVTTAIVCSRSAGSPGVAASPGCHASGTRQDGAD
eukprot:1224708-Prymnesium_polylepis.1